jgi:hypothetical protein
MDKVLENIISSLSEQQPKNKKCNRKNKVKFENDIFCINEELEYKEIDSSNFKFHLAYQEETNFFKNIYIDEFKHTGKKSVDLLTLSKFNDERKGRFYFIEVKSNLVCYRWTEIKDKLIDTIENIENSIENTDFVSSIIVIGKECLEDIDKSATTNKIKKDIEDIEFLDMPFGKVNIYMPNNIITKILQKN